MSSELGLTAFAVCFLLVAALAGGAGYMLGAGQQDLTMTHAPAVRLPDGSLIAERVPTKVPKIEHELPKGAKPIRSTRIKLGLHDCPAVTVDCTLIDTDQGTRIIAASNAEIISATDRVFVSQARAPRWAAGVSYDPVNAQYGVWAERDLWRIRVGVDVAQDRIAARVGWTW